MISNKYVYMNSLIIALGKKCTKHKNKSIVRSKFK